MPWVRLDDQFPDHPKMRAVSSNAAWLHLAAIAYTSRQETNPFVPDGIVPRLTAVRQWRRAQRALVDAGLWLPVEGGFQLSRDHEPLPTWRPKIPTELRHEVYERDGFRCMHCGASEPLSLDHIWPWSKGGQDTYENLQTLCIPCNSKKGDR